MSSFVMAALTPGVAGAETRRVAAGGNLQAALDAAQAGDVVLLAPGATYSGNFILRNKSGTGFITLQTEIAQTGALAPGIRLTPATAVPLARLQSPNGVPVLRTEAFAHHWRIQLLQFGPNHKGYSEIIRLGDGSAVQNTSEMVPYAFVIDRVYVYGDPLLGQKRGIAMNARDVTVTNSHVSDIKAIGQDTQAITAWNGPGPFVIENNYLEASGENFLLGGAGPDIPNLVATGVTFRRNHLSRPVSWRDPIVAAPSNVTVELFGSGSLPAGAYAYTVFARRPAGQTSYAQSSASPEKTAALGEPGSVRLNWAPVADATEYRVYRQAPDGVVYWTVQGATFTDNGAPGTASTAPGIGTRWMVKNIFELKNARDVLVEYNLFENNWLHGQVGYAIVFTVRNSSGTCYWCTIENVDFRYNVVRHVAGGLNILGYDSPEPSAQGRDIRITNNLFYDVNHTRWGGTGIFVLVGEEPRNVIVDHNTVDHSGTSLVSAYGGVPGDRREIYGFKFTNNIARHGKYGVFGAGAAFGMDTITTYFPDGVFKRNLFSLGSASRYPADNFFTPVFEAQFIDFNGADFRLAASSPLRSAGTDGKDLGADFQQLLNAFAAALPTPIGPLTESGATPKKPNGVRVVKGS